VIQERKKASSLSYNKIRKQSVEEQIIPQIKALFSGLMEEQKGSQFHIKIAWQFQKR